MHYCIAVLLCHCNDQCSIAYSLVVGAMGNSLARLSDPETGRRIGSFLPKLCVENYGFVASDTPVAVMAEHLRIRRRGTWKLLISISAQCWKAVARLHIPQANAPGDSRPGRPDG